MRSPGDYRKPSTTASTESGTGDGEVPASRLRLFAILLASPERDSAEVLSELRIDHSWLKKACDQLAGFSLAHWQAEHTRLFVTGFPKTACPPFKSAYHGQGLHSSAAEDLAGFYRELGLFAQDMPPDYLGTLLECWAFLIEQSHDGAAKTLWAEHLAPWLPRFASDLKESSQLELYRALADQLDALCIAMTEATA